MKTRMTLLIFTAAVLLSSSSPWEGAGALAPAGVLPETGFYIATNSYPRNTVVDITNIETNKSTRVIVADSLNSPGLLAVVSREAAELIGMRDGSVSRIRMVQPSDPIAYLRFSEGMSSGLYDYDSGNIINEENLLDEHYGEDRYRPYADETEPGVPGMAGRGGPGYYLEPEWGGRGRSIIDLPGYRVEPEYITEYEKDKQPYYPPYDYQYDFIAEPLRDEIIKDISPRIEENPPREIIKDVPDFIVMQPQEPVSDPSLFPAEEPMEEIIKDVPEYIAETRRDEVIKDVPEKTEYVLVPSEERKPANGLYGIDPADIIPGIAEPAKPAPVITPAPVPVMDSTFSIPRINGLERGKYYVQVAAVNSPDLVDSAALSIDRHYNPVVFKDGDNWYRILLGPLNQGESAAVLQRFRSIGYSDAFVRHVR